MVYNQKLITDDIIENTSDLPPRIDTRRIQASRVFICDSSAGTSSLFRAKGGKRNVTVISRYFKATMWKTSHFFWWGSYGYLFFWEFMSEWEKLRINGHENTDNLGARMHSEYAGKMGVPIPLKLCNLPPFQLTVWPWKLRFFRGMTLNYINNCLLPTHGKVLLSVCCGHPHGSPWKVESPIKAHSVCWDWLGPSGTLHAQVCWPISSKLSHFRDSSRAFLFSELWSMDWFEEL